MEKELAGGFMINGNIGGEERLRDEGFGCRGKGCVGDGGSGRPGQSLGIVDSVVYLLPTYLYTYLPSFRRDLLPTFFTKSPLLGYIRVLISMETKS